VGQCHAATGLRKIVRQEFKLSIVPGTVISNAMNLDENIPNIK
jgi:hypothetical protein